MKHIPNTLKFFAVAFSLSPAAWAAEHSYDYAEVQFVDTEIDAGGGDVDGDGIKIGGSVSLTDALFAFANYSTLDFDGSVDGDTFDIGVGYRRQVKPGIDFEGSVAFVTSELDGPLSDVDDNGFQLAAGFRGWLTDQVELRGGIKRVDFDDFDSETSLVVGGQYYLTDQWSFGGSLDIGDDTTSLFLGGRFNFGGIKGLGRGRSTAAP